MKCQGPRIQGQGYLSVASGLRRSEGEGFLIWSVILILISANSLTVSYFKNKKSGFVCICVYIHIDILFKSYI